MVFKSVDELAPGKSLTYQVKVKGTLSGSMRFGPSCRAIRSPNRWPREKMTKVYGE